MGVLGSPVLLRSSTSGCSSDRRLSYEEFVTVAGVAVVLYYFQIHNEVKQAQYSGLELGVSIGG